MHRINSTYIWNGDRADDRSRSKIPKSKSVRVLDAKRWLQDCDWDHEVGCENDILIPVNAEAVWAELLS